MINFDNLTEKQKRKLFELQEFTPEQFEELYNTDGLSEEELGELFEIEILLLLNKILPSETPIFYDLYFETDDYIKELGEYKSLQMDIIILLKIPFIIECKFLTDEKYSKLENCKSKDKKYKGKLCLFRADGTRIKKSLYGLNQNKSHIEYMETLLNKKIGKTTVYGITVFGGLSKKKILVKNIETGHYVKHKDDFPNYILGAQKWEKYYEKSRELVEEVIKENQWLDVNRKLKHINQVHFFERK